MADWMATAAVFSSNVGEMVLLTRELELELEFDDRLFREEKDEETFVFGCCKIDFR